VLLIVAKVYKKISISEEIIKRVWNNKGGIGINWVFYSYLCVMSLRVRRRLSDGISMKIDKLTNSIEETFTGKSVETDFAPLTTKEAEGIYKPQWRFDWQTEITIPGVKVKKMFVKKEPDKIIALISYKIYRNYVYVYNIEKPDYETNNDHLGITGNLIAYACKISKENGGKGKFILRQRMILLNITRRK
jgi:hypothetical protein